MSGFPRAIVANVIDYNIVLNKFGFQLCDNVLFRTKTLRKGINPLIHAAMC